MRRTSLPALALLPMVLMLLVACSSRQESYCDAVKDHQSGLADAMGGTPSTALLRALPIFRDLQSKAPDDVLGDWRTVTAAIQTLHDALDDAHVDPATYDRDHPPADVTKAQLAAIDSAAQGLTRPGTVTALASVQQESLDVCHTPLSL